MDTVRLGPADTVLNWADSNVVTQPRMQGKNACWAFASTGVVESAYLFSLDREKRRPDTLHLSEQQIVSCSHAGTVGKHGCGWWAFGYSSDSGLAANAVVRSAKGRICDAGPRVHVTRWGYVAKDGGFADRNDIKRALIAYGPIGTGMYATKRFLHWSRSEVFAEEENVSPEKVNHLVMLVGWNDRLRAWRVKNSWDTTWADHGYAWIRWDHNAIGYGAAWVDLRSAEKPIIYLLQKTGFKNLPKIEQNEEGAEMSPGRDRLRRDRLPCGSCLGR